MARLSSLSEEQKSFPDLTLLQKYDAVLDVLFDLSGKSPTLDHLSGELLSRKKKVHWGEIWDILNTMNGDGYLYNNYTNDKNEQIFLLSFNGKLLKESGGLERKIEREKKKDDLDIKLKDISIRNVNTTRIIAAASLVISLAVGGVQITKFIDEKLNPKYSIQEKEVKQLLQLQQDLSKNLQLIQLSISVADTSTKKVRIEK